MEGGLRAVSQAWKTVTVLANLCLPLSDSSVEHDSRRRVAGPMDGILAQGDPEVADMWCLQEHQLDLRISTPVQEAVARLAEPSW